MIDFYSKIGRGKTVLLISSLTCILAVLLTLFCAFVLHNFGIAVNPVAAIIISSSVTIVIAPILSWFIIGQILKIHDLEAEMRELATYDSLTGLLCRRVFLEQSYHLLKIAKREGLSFSIAIMDLDNLKNINDKYGHGAGDKTLVSYSNVAKLICRESDLICRFGGDEFLFFLPSTSSEQAVSFSERFIAVLNENLEGSVMEISYSVSIGLATYPDLDIENMEEIILAADKALYQAKQKGGNQIHIFN